MNSMTSVYVMLVGLALLAAYMHFKKKAKRGTGPLASDPHGWRIEYSEGLPAQPKTQGLGWEVVIPLVGQGFLGSIKLYDIPKLRVGGTFVLKGRVVGNGAVSVEFPDNPASATLIVQRRGDNGVMLEHRWYSDEMIFLKEGSFELRVPLTVQAMGAIMGSRDPNAFAAAINDPWNVQVGFGSAGGRAHSVHATSPTTFYMDSLTYED